MTVRLYDTSTKSLVALPDPPAKVGMYVCGPTVYQRAHIGNAVPFVIFAWLRNWLRERGYDVTYVHNITDVNDKIYEAAPGASAARAREATQWYLDDTRSFGLEMPDEQPLATETIPEIVALIEELIASGPRVRGRGRRLLPGRELRELRCALGPATRPGRGAGAEPAEGGCARLRALEGDQGGRGHVLGIAVGTGRPGWHIECSAMAEKTLGPEFLIHGGGLDLVFPHHENERAQSQAVGRPFAKIWMHNGLLRFTGEKMSKSVGNVATIQEVIAGWGREVALLFLMTGHWRKPLEFSEEAMTAAGVQVESLRNALRGETRSAGDWDELAAVLDDDFNTPGSPRDLPPLGARGGARRASARSRRLRARGARRRGRRSGRDRGAGPRARRGTGGARLRRVGSPARRDLGRRLGSAGREQRTRGLRARAAAVTRELIYGRNAVREALRGRREVLELWVSERAAASLDWLGEGPRPQIVKERDLTEAAGEPRSSGRRRLGEPVSLRRSVGARRGRDAAPRVPRPGDRPAESRRRDPLGRRRGRHRRDRAGPRRRPGDAGRVPLVGRNRRAPAGRRRPEPGPLPRRDQARRPLVVRRDGGCAADDVAGRPHRRRRPRLRRRGKGCASPRPQDL